MLETLMALGGGGTVGLADFGLDHTSLKNWQAAAVEGVGGGLIGLLVGAFSRPLGASIAGGAMAQAVKRLIWEWKVRQASTSTTPQAQTQGLGAIDAPAYYALPAQQMGAIGAPLSHGMDAQMGAIGAELEY